MSFDFENCRNVFYRGLIDTLTANVDAVRWLGKDQPFNVDGVAFGIFPWHQTAGLSFRTSDDKKTTVIYDEKEHDLDIRYSPADWKFGHHMTDDGLESVGEHLGEVYPMTGGTPGQEVHHLLLLAAADALLDEGVAHLLQEFGLHAEIRTDQVPWGGFEYMVFDDDQAFKANYCEIILANRVAKRLIGHVIA
jgi:hypothetical protein